ncbi:MAG: ribulose-phosphate 3-epimerase [Bacteroidetes bacterium]|nr:MAG: ribulose-phosphate 3-epimerase [Bacteroidota bacterium]
MSHLIAPSMLSADFLNLGRDVEMINNSQADWFHIDVMDGMFVPNISFGFPIMKAISKIAKKPMDVHLMIEDPDRYFDEFKKNGADIITVHYEAVRHLHRSVHAIKELGMQAGVVLNPHTSVNNLEDIIADLDVVLLMSVNPGYGGQKFIENTYAKLGAMKDLIIQKNSKALIEVDGGVGTHNIGKLVAAGADVLVAGSAVFGSDNPMKTIEILKRG